MNCTLTLSIKKIGSREPSKIVLEVPETQIINSPEDLLRLLRSKGKLKEFLEAVNESKFPLTSLKREEIDGDMIGNFSITTASHTLSESDYTEKLLKMCTDSGIDSNEYSLLISDGNSKFTGTYLGTNGHYITIIPPTSSAINAYLKYRIVKQRFSGDIRIKEVFSQLLNECEKITNKASENLKSCIASKNIDKLIDLYFNDYASYKLLQLLSSCKEVNELIDEYFNFKTLDLETLKDEIVKEFINEFPKEINKPKVIDIAKANDLCKKYGFLKDENPDYVQLVQYVNNHIIGNHYFDIKFIGEKAIVFKSINYEPDFTKVTINSKYFGNKITPILELNGYYLYECNNKYYVSDVLPIQEEYLGKEFTYLEAAKKYLFNVRRQALNFNSIQIKMNLEGFEYFKTSKDLPGEFNFVGKDIKLPTFDNYYFNVKNGILIRKDFISIVKILAENKEWNFIPKDKISLLNTPFNMSAYFILKQKYENEGLSESEASNKALSDIENAPDLIYTASLTLNDTLKGRIYVIKKIDNDDSVKLFLKSSRILKLDIMAIAENLSSRFGVTTHTYTWSEILELLNSNTLPKEITFNSHAFIYNGEIYINMDNVKASNLIHEFGHLIFGTIKLTNPKLYDKFITFIDNLRENEKAAYLFSRYVNSKRSRIDINEEILADLFGKFISKGFTKAANLLEVQDVMEMKEAYKLGINKVFGTSDQQGVNNTDIITLLNMTIEGLTEEFGSAFNLGKQSESSYFDKDLSMKSRKMLRVIELLISKKIIEENCN